MRVNSIVGVGVIVAVAVMVGVIVLVADALGRRAAVSPDFTATLGVLLWVRKKTRVAPIATNNANNPRAAGKLKVTSGMRVPWTVLAGRALAVGLKSLPQTWQRLAFSATRDPQVEQILVGEEGLVVVIIKCKVWDCPHSLPIIPVF